MNLKDEHLHNTPADIILHRDKNKEERKTDFHYRSVIGQLNYLAATTRPEIQFAVHQCAKFSNNPKMIHKKAVKRIIQYLKRTKDKGLILQVDKSKGIKYFIDADFAGSYLKNKETNPRDCLSRTGFVIWFTGCPIVWSSKLQSSKRNSRTSQLDYV